MLAALIPAASCVYGQTYPAKPIRIIAAQSAGGVTDALARTFAQKFNEAWKQPVVVENRAGAAGNIGTEIAVKAPADGYTLLLSSAGPIVINPGLYPALGYDPLKSLVPIAFIATSALVLVTHPSVPAKSVRELVTLARARPRRLTYGSGGSGSPPHLTAELFKTTARVDITHVPFKGSAPSVLALVGGQIDLSFSTVVIVLPQVRANRLRALAVTSPRRSAAMPELPTMMEAGMPGVESQQWFGLFGPVGLPAEIAARLNAEVARILALPGTRERLARDGAEPGTFSPVEFAAFLQTDAARWTRVIRESGARAD
ncbi:MAG: tripartite tricarboxylate transporter substrate binding protein [Burkholderiales bacterium]